MSALRTTRLLFSVPPPTGQTYEVVFPILLPPICLNRYYVAEGVKVFSQQTWCQVTGGKGRDILTSILEPTLDYYVEQSQVDNHAVSHLLIDKSSFPACSCELL